VIGTEREMRERARGAAGVWIANLAKWDLYTTLTYDPKRVAGSRPEQPDASRAPSDFATMRHVQAWLLGAEHLLGRVVSAAYGLEKHSSGFPHWHGLLAAGGVSSEEFAALSKSWYEPHGFARFDRVQRDDTQAIASYVAKYLSKGPGELLVMGGKAGSPLAGQVELPGLSMRDEWLMRKRREGEE